MKNFTFSSICFLFLLFFISCDKTVETKVDIIIIGGGASGVTAGIQSARMGSTSLIIEESDWLGGMLTSAGVSAIDGNHKVPGGLWGEFRQNLITHYGSAQALETGWVSSVLFEPSVGNKIFHEMTAKEDKLTIWKKSGVKDIKKEGNQWIVTVIKADGTKNNVRADILIDATELGDIAKKCGVKYDIGMESRNVTRESVALEEANNIVQDLTYVAILKDYGKDVTIDRPDNYDPAEFACCCENEHCFHPKEENRVWSKDMMITYGKLPNNKYMINWPIEGNDYYVNLIEMSPEERIEALKPAKARSMRFLYFIQHELGYSTLGLADDEYDTPDLLPYIPYHRESRRIHGLVRFTLNHVSQPFNAPEKLYRTNIAVGDYPVDHHHARCEDYYNLPNLYFHPIPSFGLPLGTLIPKDVDGLIVAEKSISVSNVINGSTRLQPVVLQIGQAAGALAALSVQNTQKIDKVPVRDVQNAILDANGYLLPYLDVPVGDTKFKSYQRIGSTGILRGIGKNVHWSNEMWLRTDTILLKNELEGIYDYYPYTGTALKLDKTPMTIQEAIELIEVIIKEENISIQGNIPDKSKRIWDEFNFQDFNLKRNITRGEIAVLFDQLLDPFNNKSVNIKGELYK